MTESAAACSRLPSELQEDQNGLLHLNLPPCGGSRRLDVQAQYLFRDLAHMPRLITDSDRVYTDTAGGPGDSNFNNNNPFKMRHLSIGNSSATPSTVSLRNTIKQWEQEFWIPETAEKAEVFKEF